MNKFFSKVLALLRPRGVKPQSQMDLRPSALLQELIEIRKLNRTITIMASALENLTAATTRLATSVDAAVTVINTPHPTDAQVQTAAELINAQADRLDGAVNPPASPVPVPTPAPTA